MKEVEEVEDVEEGPFARSILCAMRKVTGSQNDELGRARMRRGILRSVSRPKIAKGAIFGEAKPSGHCAQDDVFLFLGGALAVKGRPWGAPAKIAGNHGRYGRQRGGTSIARIRFRG